MIRISPAFSPTALAAVGSAVVKKAGGLLTVTTPGESIFTVSGGRIFIVELFGVVTSTAISGAARTMFLQATPAVGAVSALCTAANVAGAALGRFFTLPGGSVTTFAQGSGTGGIRGVVYTASFLVAPGTVQAVSSSAAAETGRMDWTLVYLPVDVGATVVAA